MAKQCFRVDVFDGRKKVGSEVVTISKVDSIVNQFENYGMTVRKKKVDCEDI